MQKKMEFNTFSIKTWSLHTVSTAKTRCRNHHLTLGCLQVCLIHPCSGCCAFLLSTQWLEFSNEMQVSFVIFPKNSPWPPISLRANIVVLTMAKGCVRLVSSNLFAMFLSGCCCSEHTGLLVIPWPHEALSPLAISSFWNIFALPSAWLIYSRISAKWPLMREDFCDHSL